MTHFREIPLGSEWKIDYGSKRRNRKLIYEAVAAQGKDYGGLGKVQAGEGVCFGIYLSGRSYQVPGLLRKKSC